MLEAFQPTLKSNSPRMNGCEPDIFSKLFGKRLPIPTCISKDRRIQVTLDTDTFIRLWIKQSSDALDIKYAVLYKLAIDAEPSYFLFYHENGIQSSKYYILFIITIFFSKKKHLIYYSYTFK